MPTPPTPMLAPALSLDDVRRATQLLASIVEDRARLLSLPEADRLALLENAGRVVYPNRDARDRLSKTLRRERREARRERDREVRATAEIRALRKETVFSAPALPAPVPPERPPRVLEKPATCYVCKASYTQLHSFYDAMCTACGDFNYAKRFQRAPLEGKVALLTGARVKIGFQAGLMLLRSGARVIATTRFPHDAAQRYAREPDFSEWGHRLHVHGLDLRHAPSVELFASYLTQKHERLDILINNAAQTVRRPPGFYTHLQEVESRPSQVLPAEQQRLLAGHDDCVKAVGGSDPAALTTWRSGHPALGLVASAALSQLPYALETEGDVERLFPANRLDADLQQVDLRSVNTWRLTLAEVATAEMLEVHLVNAVAPFILCGKLKPLMLKSRDEPGHIVNVSAMEGSFSRGTKTDKHPHTNMAKAALNMMTLTSAPDYARDRIYMNTADTGWVTDEDPAVHADRKREELDFQPPLDIVDGAARVVDPVFSAVNTGETPFGKFFKDYQPTNW